MEGSPFLPSDSPSKMSLCLLWATNQLHPRGTSLGVLLSPRGRGSSQAPVHGFVFLLFP